MAAFMFTGLVNLKGAMSIGWGSDIVLFVVLLFVFVAFMEATGTTTYLAAFLMTRKFVVGHPWRLIFMIFLCAYLLTTFCGVFPWMLITWGFIYTICDVLGYKPFDKFSNLFNFGGWCHGRIMLWLFLIPTWQLPGKTSTTCITWLIAFRLHYSPSLVSC